jgi:excisionase family DNA binding protein
LFVHDPTDARAVAKLARAFPEIGTLNNSNPAAWMTVTAAAAALGCGRTKAYALMNDGTLPYVEFGAVRRIRRDDLDVVLRRGTRKRRGAA